MSRSNPTPTNPAQHFFEWKGSEGKLEYYDRDKKQSITVPLPMEFLVLDELATITGFSKQAKSRYWSNEVRSTKKEEFTVRTANGIAQTGLYEHLADVRGKGAKYAKSIYFAHKNSSGEYIIGNFKAAGSALSAWIDFSGTCVPTNGKVRIARGEKQEAPTGEFYPPLFKYESSNAEEDKAAVALDKELQIYLSQYLAAAEYNRASQDGHEQGSDVPDWTPPADDNPGVEHVYEETKDLMKPEVDATGKKHAPAPKIEDIDNPIDLSEIPF